MELGAAGFVSRQVDRRILAGTIAKQKGSGPTVCSHTDKDDDDDDDDDDDKLPRWKSSDIGTTALVQPFQALRSSINRFLQKSRALEEQRVRTGSST
jgi:hypothetical protein